MHPQLVSSLQARERRDRIDSELKLMRYLPLHTPDDDDASLARQAIASFRYESLST